MAREMPYYSKKAINQTKETEVITMPGTQPYPVLDKAYVREHLRTEDITVFESLGLAVEDVACAIYLYRTACGEG